MLGRLHKVDRNHVFQNLEIPHYSSTGTFGDVELALRNSGFGAEEAARFGDAIFNTAELSFSLPKDSSIDPGVLQANLKATGLIVDWVNEPVA